MKIEIISWLAGLSILLHTPWELVQAHWLIGCKDKPWYIKLRNCFVGIVLDALYTIGLYFLFIYFKESEVWLLHAGIEEYALIFIISLLIAYICEWLALKSGIWQFHESTPRLPKVLGNVPLLPVIQLPLLVSLTFFITQLLLS
jgi:hypothetical protein